MSRIALSRRRSWAALAVCALSLVTPRAQAAYPESRIAGVDLPEVAFHKDLSEIHSRRRYFSDRSQSIPQRPAGCDGDANIRALKLRWREAKIEFP